MPNLNLNVGSAPTAIWTTGDGLNPSPGETVTFAWGVFEWNGVGANINVPIGATLSDSIDNLIVAMEDYLIQLAGEIGEPVNASFLNVGSKLLLIPLRSDGHTPDSSEDLPPLDCSQPLDPWVSVDRTPPGGQVASGTFTVSPGHITQGIAFVGLPLNANIRGLWQCYDGVTGQIKPTTDLVLFSPGGGSVIVVVFGVGPGGLVPGDYVAWFASGS